jgi:hypothetical protein
VQFCQHRSRALLSCLLCPFRLVRIRHRNQMNGTGPTVDTEPLQRTGVQVMIHSLMDALPAITVGLRAPTAAITFTVALHRALHYWRRSRDR